MSAAVTDRADAADTTPQLTVQDSVATVRLRKPDHANRLNPQDLDALRCHVDAVNQDENVLVLRFMAEGKYFCSGYNIMALADSGAPGSLYFGAAVDVVEAARPVTLAVIQGGAYGGGTDLSLACDFRIGTPEANMFMPAVKLGLHFYASGMRRYVSRLGVDQAKRLFLTAERIDAQEMLRIGFLTELVPAEALQDRVRALSDALANMAPIALLGVKHHLNRIVYGDVDTQAIEAAVLQSEASEDMKEGALAWKEKRAPRFQGR